jgi:hypothetical protein
MRRSDVVAAFWILEAHADYLMERWREHHA